MNGRRVLAGFKVSAVCVAKPFILGSSHMRLGFPRKLFKYGADFVDPLHVVPRLVGSGAMQVPF